MAAIAVQAGKTVSPVNDYQPIMRTYIAGEALTTGLLVKLDTNGKAVKAGLADVQLGVVVGQGGGAGYAVSVVARGVVDGYDVNSLAYGTPVYSSATGVLDTTVTSAVLVGRVTSMSEPGGSKVVEIML